MSGPRTRPVGEEMSAAPHTLAGMSELDADDLPQTQTYTFSATGLTCGHCANAVIDELTEIDDVMSARVEVVKGGASQITIEALTDVSRDEVAAALTEAGDYKLV